MPWKRPVTDAEGHPAYAFHGRVGELTDARAEQTGHLVIVVGTTWSRVGGRLWWRQWGRPLVVADVTVIPADVKPGTLVAKDDLEWDFVNEELHVAVSNWTRGEATLDDIEYRVDWLSAEEGDTIAIERWGWDLPSQRLPTQ